MGIVETKKKDISEGFLKNTVDNSPFSWCFLEPIGTAGGILVGANTDSYNMLVGDILRFTVSVLLTSKKSGFTQKVIVVYGSAYEEKKQEFLDELEEVMGSWQGPVVLGGDFNLVRFSSDKSNGVINHKWADLL